MLLFRYARSSRVLSSFPFSFFVARLIRGFFAELLSPFLACQLNVRRDYHQIRMYTLMSAKTVGAAR